MEAKTHREEVEAIPLEMQEALAQGTPEEVVAHKLPEERHQTQHQKQEHSQLVARLVRITVEEVVVDTMEEEVRRTQEVVEAQVMPILL